MKAWIKERDGYTRIQNHSKYFLDRKYIFVVEVQNLEIKVSNTEDHPIVVRNMYIYQPQGHYFQRLLWKNQVEFIFTIVP